MRKKGVGGRVKREGTYIYLWLTHVDIQKKPTQYCKAIILQLKVNNFFKRWKSKHWVSKNKNSPAMNTVVHMSFFSYGFLSICVQQWYCGVIQQFYSWYLMASPHCSPQWLYPFASPPTVQEGSLFSTPSPAFIICGLFEDYHPDRYEMIPHCRPMEQDRKPRDKSMHLWVPYL